MSKIKCKKCLRENSCVGLKGNGECPGLFQFKCKICIHENQYTSNNMIDFASWVFGSEIDSLSAKDQLKCKNHKNALEYWTKNIKEKIC